MDIKNKFLWFVGVSTAISLLILCVLGAWFWTQLPAADAAVLMRIGKRYFIYIFGGFLLLLGIFLFIIDGLFHTYIIPISRLIEETLLVNSVNPAHRIKIEGSRDIVKLSHIINQGADRFEALKHDVDERIARATAEAQTEKNILAAIMAELPEGVLICNAGGQILLYNNRIRQFFSTDSPSGEPTDETGKFIGLGRSIFGIIDRNCIVHALDEIGEKLQRKEENIAAYFVVIGKDKNLLRAETVPILNQQRQFTGFIIIFHDITQQMANDDRTRRTLQELTTGVRHATAGIRSAVEAILEYPDMDREQLQRLTGIVHRESINIGNLIAESDARLPDHVQTQWPLVQTDTSSLLESLAKKVEDRLDAAIDVQPETESRWLKVCNYSFYFAALFLIDRMTGITGCRRFACSVRQSKRFVTIEFLWQGSPIKIETLRSWNKEALRVADEKIPMTLGEVLRYHNAEIWSYPERSDESEACLGLFLPAVDLEDPGKIRKVTILPESRPEFYDFDLFNQPGQVPELDNRKLSELSYTVFDTETTGLNPTGGDEIISIGAVRIVNGRLLRKDVFDQIVDPQRDLPAASIRFHGIRPEMVKGQPTIHSVLPRFQQFAEDTILVAHNAAFDMRMLQVKEAATGIKFINPVLDTMLLSAVVHPAQSDHNLEAIAERLGVRIVGRHTALGDAMVTGEIFLKLLALLAEKKIVTLKEARMASQNTYYARLKY